MKHIDPFDIARQAFERCNVQEVVCPFSGKKSPDIIRQTLHLNPDYVYPSLIVSPISFYCDEVLEEEKDYNLPLPVASGQETHSERTFLDSAENSCETFGSFRGLFNCEGNRTPKSLSEASEEFTPTPSLVSSPELPQSEEDIPSDEERPLRATFSPVLEETTVESPPDAKENPKKTCPKKSQKDASNQRQKKQKRLKSIVKKISTLRQKENEEFHLSQKTPENLKSSIEKITTLKQKENEKQEVLRNNPKMTGDETLVISVDALRDDGRILKHFNIPIAVSSFPEIPNNQESSSGDRSLPLKKRYQTFQEDLLKYEKSRRKTRNKNILKDMLQKSKSRVIRAPSRRADVSDDVPLDLSRYSRRETTQRISSKPTEIPRVIEIPAQEAPCQPLQPVHHPIPLRYLVQYPQVRNAEESSEVPIFYPPQTSGINGIPRIVNPPDATPYSYPPIIPSNTYPKPVTYYPVPARYYERHPEAVQIRKSIPQNVLQAPQMPVLDGRNPLLRSQAASYVQYPPGQLHYLPQSSVIYRPRQAEKPRNPPTTYPYSLHPPQTSQYLPSSNYLPYQTAQFIPQTSQRQPNSQIVQEVPHLRPVRKSSSERAHLRNLPVENGTKERIAAPKATFSDEIPIFHVRNPSYRGVPFPTHEPHTNGVYFSHGI